MNTLVNVAASCCAASFVLAGCAEACGPGEDVRCADNKVELCRLTSGRNAQWIEAFDCDDTSKVCLVGEERHANAADYCVAVATDAAIDAASDGSVDAGSDASFDSN